MKTVFVRWSAVDVHQMTFVRWKRRHLPKPQRGWWGICAVVHSPWMFDYCSELRRYSHREHLKRKQHWLAPHTELYLTRRGALTGKGSHLKRPTTQQYERLLRRRK